MLLSANSVPRFSAAFFIAALAAASPQAFDVASVKPNNSGSGSTSESTGPGRITYTNASVNMLIQTAFGVRDFQISGGPGWLNSDKYDIVATTGTSKDLSGKELEPYFQALLADRFKLKFHREKKEFQIYSLVLAKGGGAKTGAKMTPHAGEGDSSTNISNGSGKSTVSARNVSMENFAGILSGRLDRAVIDNTGLPGGYDLKIEWAPDAAGDSGSPSLFTALQEQLGLKLETTKGPVDIIVIDGVEKPSDN
jgi:uncharacterized protein (TIGR03435 family)